MSWESTSVKAGGGYVYKYIYKYKINILLICCTYALHMIYNISRHSSSCCSYFLAAKSSSIRLCQPNSACIRLCHRLTVLMLDPNVLRLHPAVPNLHPAVPKLHPALPRLQLLVLQILILSWIEPDQFSFSKSYTS